MHDTVFDHLSSHDTYFPIPQIDDVFTSIVAELENGRALCCFTGFPKSGKSAFLSRLGDVASGHSLYLPASREQSLATIVLEKLSAFGDHKTALGKFFEEHKQAVLLIDNAHLLKDQDFDLLVSMYAFAEHLQTRLQIVLGGNGELMLHLGRPENRTLFNMLGSVWHLPKLTIGQSLDYVRFLLKSAGLPEDLIADPLPLAKRAAGTIGVLRMLTITFALKALGGQKIDNPESILDFKTALEPPVPPDAEAMDLESLRAPWIGRIFIVVMLTVITVSVLALLWLVPGSGVRNLLLGQNSAPGPTSDTPGASSSISPEAQPGPVNLPVAKTVFRKRTSEGPYSLRLGVYPSVEAMLLHLPRFLDLELPLFWSSPEGIDSAELYAGRFETGEAAMEFATRHKLVEAAVALRPFVVTVGPVHGEVRIKQARYAAGLPEAHPVFRRELATGEELQFALERTLDEALARCAAIEKSGLSCAVTEYD
jgi:hypothetical protein